MLRFNASVVLIAALFSGCADTKKVDQVCEPSSVQCNSDVLLRCQADGRGYVVERDCTLTGELCTPSGCRVCSPGNTQCAGDKLLKCNNDGTGFIAEPVFVCNGAAGEVCDGVGCSNACDLAAKNRSYVGCEYWAVDLDNAVVSSGSAAAQQFAVAVSNTSPLEATVKVFVDNAPVGSPAQLEMVAERTIQPDQLDILFLPSKEVDGSPNGEYNTGTGTALTRAAYKIESNVPIVAYQFNPLDNVGVFSNDASLLIPTPALTIDPENSAGASYLVMGWPQTIATTQDPLTNFGTDLRAFLTIVGTRPDTVVRVQLKTAIIGNGTDIPAMNAGETLEKTLQPFEVLNLETGGFGKDADFTGTRILTDKPVAVFSGSEASDVPDPVDLTERRCCADHLEQQLFPAQTFGRSFVVVKTPSRSQALKDAGAQVSVQKETEYFRVLSDGEFVGIATNLPAPFGSFSLNAGEFAPFSANQDFVLEADGPVSLGQFVAGQAEAGIPNELPGGDPSFIIVPPVEQFRSEYLFLTPDKYAFDFLLIAAPKGARVALDGRQIAPGCDESTGKRLCCTFSPAGAITLANDTLPTEFEAIKCQLSFPQVIPGQQPPLNLEPGSQNDGVHRIVATLPVGIVVYGFDAFVSYGYPGGTDLTLINIE